MGRRFCGYANMGKHSPATSRSSSEGLASEDGGHLDRLPSRTSKPKGASVCHATGDGSHAGEGLATEEVALRLEEVAAALPGALRAAAPVSGFQEAAG